MTKEKNQSALKRPVEVSATLAVIVGKGPMPRTEVTQKLWVYIKKHGLQDPKAKRMINPDADLAKVLGTTKPMDMFEMTKKVTEHVKSPAMSSAK